MNSAEIDQTWPIAAAPVFDSAFWIAVGMISLLICLSAFFSGSETALTSASRGKLRSQADKGDRAAGRALAITNNRERLIGAVLLGNNLVNILAAALATSLFTRLFGDSGVALATLVMTLLILFFAELLPKTYSILHPERASRRVSLPISGIVFLFHPIVSVFRVSAEALLRLFGANKQSQSAEAVREEIAGTIALGHSTGEIQKEYRDRVLGALDLGELYVREVMRHRSEIEMISLDTSLDDVIAVCSATHFSRLPVNRPGSEEIAGILHTKDALALAVKSAEQDRRLSEADIFDEDTGILAKPYFVPETTTLDDQLRQFRHQRTRFALVVDEYGALQGVLTLEDILAEIVGDITEEHNKGVEIETPQVEKGSLVVDGAMPIRDLNREFDLRLPEDSATTIAGLLLYEAQIIPDVAQVFTYHGFTFEVLERKANRITRIRLTKR